MRSPRYFAYAIGRDPHDTPLEDRYLGAGETVEDAYKSGVPHLRQCANYCVTGSEYPDERDAAHVGYWKVGILDTITGFWVGQ